MRIAVLGVIGLLAIALLAAIAYQYQRRFHNPLITTTYQAVMLVNGTVLHGRIDHLGTNFPVLRGAVTVRDVEDAGSGRTRYEATYRKAGSHGADHIILPVTSILYVEPVQPDSPVGQAIERAMSR